MKSKAFKITLCAVAATFSFCACTNENTDKTESSGVILTNISEASSLNETSEIDIEISSAPEESETETSKQELETENEEDTKENNSAIDKANNIDELSDIISEDVENTLSTFNEAYEQLINEVDTYDKYVANSDRVEAFYAKACTVNHELIIRMYNYAINYADLILNSKSSIDDKYDEFEYLCDDIYDDAGDDILDGIYDGVLDDILKEYYDGIIEDAEDTVSYDEWYNVLSNEYDWWSDARSDTYDEWSDFRSDIYDFYSDVRSALWKDDMDKANEKFEKFKKRVEKLS